MAWTLATLREEARRWLDADGDADFDATFPGLVRQAEERIYAACHIHPFRQVDEVQAEPNVPLVALPQNYVSMIGLSIAQYGADTTRINLLRRQPDWIFEAVPVSQTGRPIFYAIQDQDPNLLLAPTPAEAVRLRLEFLGKPVSLADTTGTATTWVSRNAETTLLQGVLYYGYLYEKGDADILGRFEKEFDKGLLLLMQTARTLMRRDEFRASPQAAPE
ncbi:hypothetical protein [Planktothrix phage Pra-JY27]|nr:lysozyme [Planktothrix phage Pag-Yong1]WEV89197.1 hypothetical protein [Synechococcus phage MinM2]